MGDFEDENLDRISHHIESLSKDMYEIKKLIKDKEKIEKKLSTRDARRRKSLKKAQEKFNNVSTNLKSNVYKKFKERVLELKTTKSNYIKNLILKDLGINEETLEDEENKMQIDYFSDPHFDHYFKTENMDIKTAISFFKSVFKDKKSDILIIAGDFGHHNEQIVSIVKMIRKDFYKHIVCVLGNHDYYLINDRMLSKYSANSFNRVKELRDNLNNIEGVHCLDGNVVEIEGIRFGGCDSWYDASYLKRLFPNNTNSKYTINEMWKNCLNDSKYIYGIESFKDIFYMQFSKIEAVYKECDVMITHINPSSKIEHAQKKYARNQTTAFFAFDGERFIREGSMKYWIYGHTHGKNEYEFAGVKALCNPMGYPYENLHFKLESFEI